MAFLIRWLERWQEMGWRRRRVTCSEGPQVGLEPSAAAATTKPRCMGCELYWTNAVPGRSRLQTSDYASSPHLEQNLYCPHRGIASPPLAKLNSHCGNRCCLQAQCNPCTSQYDQIISLWEADDTEIDSSHNKTRFQWASIISEPVRNDLNMRGILLPTKKKKKKFLSPECDQSCGHSVMHVSREALRFLPVLFYAVCHERPTKSSAHCEDSVLNRWQMIPQSNSLVTVTRRFKCSKISEQRFGLARKSLLHELFITVVCRPGLGFRLHAGTY